MCRLPYAFFHFVLFRDSHQRSHSAYVWRYVYGTVYAMDGMQQYYIIIIAKCSAHTHTHTFTINYLFFVFIYSILSRLLFAHTHSLSPNNDNDDNFIDIFAVCVHHCLFRLYVFHSFIFFFFLSFLLHFIFRNIPIVFVFAIVCAVCTCIHPPSMSHCFIHDIEIDIDYASMCLCMMHVCVT